jgi:hypothetical protein
MSRIALALKAGASEFAEERVTHGTDVHDPGGARRTQGAVTDITFALASHAAGRALSPSETASSMLI